jgi:hypothetical protein
LGTVENQSYEILVNRTSKKNIENKYIFPLQNQKIMAKYEFFKGLTEHTVAI